MIHDFATAPRQADWRSQSPARDLKSDKAVKTSSRKLGRYLVSVVAIGIFTLVGQLVFFNNEPELDQQPDEAAKKEYIESVLLSEEATLEGEAIEEQEIVADETDYEPVPKTENVSLKVALEPAQDAKADVKKDAQAEKTTVKEQKNTQEQLEEVAAIEVDPDYEFYDSLRQDSWPVPINKGVYVDGELADRERPIYKLQAASFRNSTDAYRLVKKLKAKKMNASVVKSVSSNGQYWYQVTIGPFVSTTKINKAQDILVSMNMMPLKRRVN